MTKTEALRLLVASRDDPVVAAWAGIIDEHKLGPGADVSPYEAWGLYQDLYLKGLIPETNFNIQGAPGSFIRRRPSTGDISGALYNLRVLRAQDTPKEEMKNSNPFSESSDNALEKRSKRTSIELRGELGPTAPGLTAPTGRPIHNKSFLQQADTQKEGSRNPFSNQDRKLPQRPLPCTRTADGFPSLSCSCGHPIELEVAGPADATEQELMDQLEHIELLDVVLFGECKECGWVWHISGGRIPPHVLR